VLAPIATCFSLVPLTTSSWPAVTTPLPSVVQRFAAMRFPEPTTPPSHGPAQCEKLRPLQPSPERIALATWWAFGLVTEEVKR
jgi:hypothetical protein